MALKAQMSAEQGRKYVRDTTTRGIAYEEQQKLYSQWANTYDNDLMASKYMAPKQTARLIKEFLNSTGLSQLRILDVCCGTGLLGHLLRQMGEDNLDGLDGNSDMLKGAREKGIYKELYLARLDSEPTQVPADSYDMTVMTGCFLEGHVNEECFVELIRIVKPGGYILLTLGESYLKTVERFKLHFEKEIARLEEAGLWKVVKRQIFPNYRPQWWNKNECKEELSEDIKNTNGVLFIMQKC